VRRFYHGRARLADPWTALSRADFAHAGHRRRLRPADPPWFSARSTAWSAGLPGPEDAAPTYVLKVEDRHWYWLYLPVARAAEFISSKIALLQQGRISIYLLYSFITLIALLVFVR